MFPWIISSSRSTCIPVANLSTGRPEISIVVYILLQAIVQVRSTSALIIFKLGFQSLLYMMTNAQKYHQTHITEIYVST